MWKLFDDLYIGIPSGITIDSVTVGKFWTTVRSNGNIGIARTLGQPEDSAAFAAQFAGRYLRDTCSYLRWKDAAYASVGVAALNAWYNTESRVSGLGGLSAPEALSGKVAYVGDTAGVKSADTFTLPKGPSFDAIAYLKLKEYDTVVIESEALITRALPGLLDIIGNDGNVVLQGYSLPATALFFAFGMPIRELRGYYPRFADTVEACAIRSIEDPTPGVLPFCIRPEKSVKIHETKRTADLSASPYDAAAFNNSFS